MEQDVQKECLICGKFAFSHEGISVLDHFICSKCEEMMVATSVEDENYSYFVERMRVLWKDLWIERIVH